MDNNQGNNTQLQQEQTPMQAPLSMGWYKFLVYFSIWAGALVNISNAGNVMSGNIYSMQGIDPERIYATYDGLKGFDTFREIMFLACAALAVVTALSLLKYKSKGPKLLICLYGAAILASVISYVGEYSIVNAVTPIQFNISSLIPSVGISVAMMIINIKYFKKREHLFNK